MFSGGSSIGLLPASTRERLSAPLPTVQAHSGNLSALFSVVKISNSTKCVPFFSQYKVCSIFFFLIHSL